MRASFHVRLLRLLPAASVAVLLPALAAAGCKCSKDHPYVPYSVGEGGQTATVASAPPAPGGPTPDADAGDYGEEPAAVAPPNVSSWTVAGMPLVAPPEHVFALALVRDIDGDGQREAVALVRSVAAPERASLLLYRPGATPVLEAPALPLDTDCAGAGAPPAPRQRLAWIGKTSVLLELGAPCGASAPRQVSRWLAVVSLRTPSRTQLELAISDPPQAPALTFEASAADRDGDGNDDVSLRVTMESPAAPFETAPRISAVLRWFDRPAGPSRDTTEPDASLRAALGNAPVRAGRVKEAAAVPPLARQVRHLYMAMCAESNAPRIVRGPGGAPPSCGSSRTLEDAAMAEVRAHVTTGDVLRAALALEAPRPAATRTAARLAEARSWIAKAVTPGSTASLRIVGALPEMETTRSPAWGALAFEPTGKLLVRARGGVWRFDPATGEEGPADLPAWKGDVVSPDGATRLEKVQGSCDGAPARALFSGREAGSGGLVLPVLLAPAGACAAPDDPATATPLAWGPSGLELLVGGIPLVVAPDLGRAAVPEGWPDQPAASGSPRSPDGRAMVLPTSMGLFVRPAAPAKIKLLTAKELAGAYGELRDCTVSNDGARVACTRGGRAFAGVWE